jgi:branched-chain amino acid transport system permease protein
VLPRGLWGTVEERLGLRLMPVGYRVVEAKRDDRAA